MRQVEAAIEKAKAMLSSHEYPDDLRTVIVAGMIDQAIEHHQAMLLLIRSGKVGSAFALARSVSEGMYRGLWINLCATDAELKKFEDKDDIELGMGRLAEAIDTSYQTGGFYANLKKRSWDALNSYTHTGMLQLGRRFTGHELNPAYTEGEIFEITTSVTTCVLLLVMHFFQIQKLPDEAKAIEALIGTYGPAAKLRADRAS